MIHVVRRDPCKGREAVEHREPIIGKRIERLVTPNWYVVVIVGDHCHAHGEKEVDRIEDRLHSAEHPLGYEKGCRKQHVNERADIRFVS